MHLPVIDLYCLPCAGASATMYLRWRRVMPSWINVIPIELPGRGMRMEESFVEDFQTLVSQLSGEVNRGNGSRWAIFGHSMGALLSYGIALRLQSMCALMPSILFVSGSPAPTLLDPDRFPDTNSDAELIADLHKQGGTPLEVFENPELLQITVDALRADYRICESFGCSQSAPLTLPIQVFAGRHDDIEPHRVDAWRSEAGNSIAFHWFDGGHFFIRNHEKSVLKIVERCLREVLEEGGDACTVSA